MSYREPAEELKGERLMAPLAGDRPLPPKAGVGGQRSWLLSGTERQLREPKQKEAALPLQLPPQAAELGVCPLVYHLPHN